MNFDPRLTANDFRRFERYVKILAHANGNTCQQIATAIGGVDSTIFKDLRYLTPIYISVYNSFSDYNSQICKRYTMIKQITLADMIPSSVMNQKLKVERGDVEPVIDKPIWVGNVENPFYSPFMPLIKHDVRGVATAYDGSKYKHSPLSKKSPKTCVSGSSLSIL